MTTSHRPRFHPGPPRLGGLGGRKATGSQAVGKLSHTEQGLNPTCTNYAYDLGHVPDTHSSSAAPLLNRDDTPAWQSHKVAQNQCFHRRRLTNQASINSTGGAAVPAAQQVLLKLGIRAFDIRACAPAGSTGDSNLRLVTIREAGQCSRGTGNSLWILFPV